MKRTTRVLSGTLAGIVQILVAIVLQIVLMPIVLRVAGQETVGVYAILLQVIGYLAVLDLGMGTALNRSLSQAIHDPERFQSLWNAGFLFLGFIGVVYALLGAIIALALPDLFHLSDAIARESQIAMFILALWGMARFPLAMYSIALISIQDLAFYPLMSALTNIARMVLAIVAVQAGQGIIGLSMASVIAEALLATLLIARCTRLRPTQWRFARRDWELLREQFGFGLRAFWGNIQGRVVFSTDNIIVGNLYGAAVTSVYYNTQTPIMVTYHLVFRLADNAAPGVNELWAARAWDKLRDIFLRLQRLTLLMVTPIAVGGWFYLRAAVSIWIGAAQYAGEAMTLWLVLFAVLTTTRYVPQIFLYASGDIHRLSQIVTLEAVANIALSFSLGAMLGPHGVALATLVSHIPTAVYLQCRVHRDLQVSWRAWTHQTCAPALCAAVPTCLVAALLSMQFTPTTWTALAIHTTIVGAAHIASSYAIGFSAADRRAVQQLLANPLALVGKRAT